MIHLTSLPCQSRIIDKWHFSDDWSGCPQDRRRYPSFRALCYFGAGLDTDRAASLFGVDADTIASWGAADQAPPQVWRTLLALAGEFEAVSAAWKGWRIHKGKLHAPDLADGFTTGQIRALPFLQGALDAYRRQGAAGRPDASTVHESKASAPVSPGLPLIVPTIQEELEGRSPLGRDAGLGKPSILPAAYADGARSRHPDRPTDRSDPTDRSGPPLDVNRVSMRLQRKSFDPGFDFVGSIDKPQEPEAGEEEGEARRRGATALPESLPLPGAGRKRPTRTPAEHRQGRIIDKWLFSDDWIGSPQDRCRYPSFRALCYFGAGLDTDRAASLFGVDADTIASWGAADQAPPQVWRTLLALAGEFEAISARWKGWRIHQGKLHAPDLADGFTTGQIRALPFLHGALDAYRRQAIPNRPDASTVHEPKGSAPVTRKAGNRLDTSTVHDEEGRSPLGRDAGLGKPSILPAAYADGARSRHPDRPTDRSDPMDRSGPRLDVNRVSMRLQRKSAGANCDLLGVKTSPKSWTAGEEEGEARRRGATALPESLPLPGAGRKRPTRTPAEHRQGRIIDIMLNDIFLPISQSAIDPPIFSS